MAVQAPSHVECSLTSALWRAVEGAQRETEASITNALLGVIGAQGCFARLEDVNQGGGQAEDGTHRACNKYSG
jgi:hypothetical protein